jgi:hypothetical protein
MKRYQFNNCLRSFYAGLGLIFLANAASALPVGFKDSWMTMGEISKDFSDAAVVYTFDQKMSVIGAGVKFKWQETPTQVRRVNLAEAELAYRVARWNLPEATFLQAGKPLAWWVFNSTTKRAASTLH